MIVLDSLRKRVLWIVAQGLLVGCLVTMIVNYAIDRRLTWSWIVVGGAVLSMVAVFAALCIRPRPLLFALLGVSVGTIPYLWLIGYAVGDLSWFGMAVGIALLSMAYAWFCYLLLVLGRGSIGTCSGAMVVGAGVLSFLINLLVGEGVDFWGWINLALICAVGLWLMIRKKGPTIRVSI